MEVGAEVAGGFYALGSVGRMLPQILFDLQRLDRHVECLADSRA